MSIQHARQQPAGERAVRLLALVSVLIVVVLIGTGSNVRVTGSGLGCPDWPLCHGNLLPPLEFHAIIEWTHRFTTSIIVWPVLALALVAWRRYREDRAVLIPALLAPALLLVQITLGAIVVVRELPGPLVAIHMANAMLVLGSLAAAAAALFSRKTRGGAAAGALPAAPSPGPAESSARFWTYLTAGATYAQIVWGSIMVHAGASGACGDDFPLCRGSLLPLTTPQTIHEIHRLLGILAALGALVVLWQVRRSGPGLRAYTRYALGILALFLVQIVLGIANVVTHFYEPVDVLHLATAAALWAALVGLSTTLALRARRTAAAQGAAARPEIAGRTRPA